MTGRAYRLLIAVCVMIIGLSHSDIRSDYDLDQADFTLNLPSALTEISGLDYSASENLLYAVNDELAIIYLIDPENGSVVQNYNFGKSGDYEGIELVGDVAYVLKSNGNIYPFDLKRKESLTYYKSPMSETNDTEGLGYDPKSNSLLIACKGSPILAGSDKKKESKAIYHFDLDKMELNPEPLFLIRDQALTDFYQLIKDPEDSDKKKKRKLGRLRNFSPSGIAVHPSDGCYYILSTVGKTLIVSDETGQVENIHFLDSKIHTQPEGICFTTDGRLYISNEGKGLVGKIYGFLRK